MEITWYKLLKKSVVYSLVFTPGMQSTFFPQSAVCSPQSAFYTNRLLWLIVYLYMYVIIQPIRSQHLHLVYELNSTNTSYINLYIFVHWPTCNHDFLWAMEGHQVSLVQTWFIICWAYQAKISMAISRESDLLPKHNKRVLWSCNYWNQIWTKLQPMYQFSDLTSQHIKTADETSNWVSAIWVQCNHESEQTLGNKLDPLWLPSFGIIFLLIWKIFMRTNLLNKLSY